MKIGKFKVSLKNPALWIIIGYSVKGTAVTIGMIYMALAAI